MSVRDLWPDFFAEHVPRLVRPLARVMLRPLDQQAREAARLATSIVGISEAYLDWGLVKAARSRGPLDRVFLLGYAPEPPGDAAELRSRLGIADSAQIAAFVGSWGATYDLELLWGASYRLRGRENLVFVISGNADTRPALKARFASLPNVRMAGWLSAQDIATLISTSAIGLLPYVAGAPQGLPNKVFEYMAHGAYQVATLRGEIEQFYAATGTGEVCDGTPEALAETIAAALERPGNRAAHTALFAQHFDAAVIYPAMVAHIEAVAASHPS